MDFDSIKVLIEDYFNGQYEVKKFLGEGSFSNVCLVKHNFLDDLRAMKIIKEPLKPTTDTETVFNEVKIATRLRNDNIINIYDAGIISAADDLAYFVMEYVPGGDLEDYLNSFIKSNVQMPLSRVLNIIKQILTGLNTLHSSNPPIVHRDLKLNNILLNYNAEGDIEIKISDFGIAKELTTKISDIDIAGTRPYMAPESFKKNISTMTDIYAVGVIFYLLLTNHYPYDIERFSLDELRDLKPWDDKLSPPSFYNGKIPQKMDEMVLKCLNINPEDRYHNAFELLSDVELFIDEIKSHQLNDNYDIGEEVRDDYSEYIVSDSIIEAFKLAKIENRLSDAIVILEKEVLKDYEIRQYYGETLRLWKSEIPDVRLISKAFTVNLTAKNYKLSCDLLKEAMAYNPSIKSKYLPYISLWEMFIELSKDKNLIKAVLSLEDLMGKYSEIHNIYKNIINILKTYSIDEILTEAIRLVSMNNLIDGANLMEFAVVCDSKIRRKYQYKLFLYKQNMGVYYKNHDIKGAAVNYAIDLGTTDSVVSYYNDGEPIIIKNHLTGKDFTPSAVLINEDGVHVGEIARNALFENNQNAITEFKHNMGFPIPFKSESSILYPEQLSSEVLKDLRVSVYNQCNVDMNQAVICVPANSNPIKTRAIMDAAELAGFRSYNLLFEPIAVSIAYDLVNSNDDFWMIYDLGGGTFNVSVIKKDNKMIEEYLSSGLNIGGNAFDWKIVEDIFMPKIINELHLTDFKRDNPKYAKIFSKLKIASEQVKMDLSNNVKSDICVNNLFSGYDFICCLNREELKQIIKPIVQLTFNSCYDLLNNNDLKISEMDKIILVGGSCISPIIQELIKNEFKRPLEYSIDPLTVVAKGAAIYAGNLEKQHVDDVVDSVSLLITYEDNNFKGRLFTLDKKDSFLGFTLESIDQTGNVVSKTPINIDGTFKMDCINENYKFNVYCGEKRVKIEDKSILMIENDEVFIPYFNEYFRISTSDLDLDNLMDSMNYLKVHSEFKEYDFIERIIELSKIDKKSNILLNIYDEQVSMRRNDIEFSKLLSNVKNKLKFLEEEISLDEIIHDKNYDELKKIHERLLCEYVKKNRNKTVRDCFYNLKYEGIYNDDSADELIEKGQLELNDSNYDGLIEIISKLYELDERVF